MSGSTTPSSYLISLIGNQRIVKTVSGPGTGETIYITEDGRAWIPWDGQTRTGEEVQRGK